MTDKPLISDPNAARPIWTAREDGLEGLPAAAAAWARTMRFTAAHGTVLIVPDGNGAPMGAVLGLGKGEETAAEVSLLAGALAKALPDGDWRLTDGHGLAGELAHLGFLLGGYRFERYRAKPDPASRARLHTASDTCRARADVVAHGVFLARDLINTPANDMGPAEIEAAARQLGGEFGAEVATVEGESLLRENLSMIHAVGRASTSAPRLIDLRWGEPDAPKVTLVGKGVSFDTGGLDIKPAAGMLLMKKDMGGAANVLGLARIVMASKLGVRLRVVIPAVENAISGASFRPGDILRSRDGRTVEIGNTDAEGRLILADALALADEEAPELLIDMATLTGAARVALGPDLPALFTDDETFAAALAKASLEVADPLWRLPLWRPYAANLASKVADTGNVTSDGFAGAITAALFLQKFVRKSGSWSHFDIFGWRPKAAAIGPVGGEAQAIRALHAVIERRFPPR